MSCDISHSLLYADFWNTTTFGEVRFRFFRIEHAIAAASAGCGIAVLHIMEESTLAPLRIKYLSKQQAMVSSKDSYT